MVELEDFPDAENNGRPPVASIRRIRPDIATLARLLRIAPCNRCFEVGPAPSQAALVEAEIPGSADGLGGLRGARLAEP
jgi:hypothetical protein